MSKRASLAEKLLERINAKIDGLTAAREELLAEIAAMGRKTPKPPADSSAQSSHGNVVETR